MTSYDCRERHCFLTRKDLDFFDLKELDKSFPALRRYETSVGYRRVKEYDSLCEVYSTVQIEEKPLPDDYEWKNIRPPSIHIDVAEIEVCNLARGEPNEYTRPIDRSIMRFGTSSRMFGCHPRGDEANKRFFAAVFRLAAKHMSNKWQWFNLETGDLVREQSGTTTWCGIDGIWMGEEFPDFYPMISYDSDVGTWLGAKALRKRGLPMKPFVPVPSVPVLS
jgi:hypothetical protein